MPRIRDIKIGMILKAIIPSTVSGDEPWEAIVRVTHIVLSSEFPIQAETLRQSKPWDHKIFRVTELYFVIDPNDILKEML